MDPNYGVATECMIERITIENFKSFRKVDLKLGQLNLFIGNNASGKSNLFDALRVLRGISGGLPIKELFEGGGRTLSGEWPGIRGGLSNAIYQPPEATRSPAKSDVRMEIQFDIDLERGDYRFVFNGAGVTVEEYLARDEKELFFFKDGKASFRESRGGQIACYPAPSLGSQVIQGWRTGSVPPQKDFVEAWIKGLSNMQFLELEPEVLRRYGSKEEFTSLGEHGRHFANLVRHICKDPKRKESYLSWLRELRPGEVDDVYTRNGAEGEPLFFLRECGRDFSASALSDGTLRFAALAAAFLQPDMPRVLAIEEIENGIHGSRLRLLMELSRSQAATTKTQVLATTHSPLLLAWLKPEEYEFTFLCKRDEMTGESHILPLTQIPHFNEIIGKQPISELFAEGWMEAAL
jgi:energy-coupling factor transporter ATP-binding protein EcfA2